MSVPIVLVDDEEIDRYITRRVIKDADVDGTVVEYKSGDEFLGVISDTARRAQEIGSPPEPMLVLLDINMPRINGFEVLEVLKKTMKDGQTCPECMIVLMFSSSNHASDKEEAFSYDFVKDYIVKPLTKEKIEEVVHKYCEA